MPDKSEHDGIVYVLTNEAMPNLVKIGMTKRDDVSQRLNELYTTGVPATFECAFAGKVRNPLRVERAFHAAFRDNRPNPDREFFTIDPDQAIGLLELMVDEDVTPEVARAADRIDAAGKLASEALRRRRPRLDFHAMGLETGSTLLFEDGETTCRVVGKHRVEHHGEELSLTQLTTRLLGSSRSVRPTPHWSFDGTNLAHIYDQTYQADD